MYRKQKFSVEEAKKKLANYCAKQDHCHFEVEQKLKEWGFPADWRVEIIAFLIEHKFLDEERFARSFVRGKFRIKKWGRYKITQHLKEKRITDKLIKKALEEINDAYYQEVCGALALKKYTLLRDTEKHFEATQKVRNYLFQKGYEFDVIDKAIRNLKP